MGAKFATHMIFPAPPSSYDETLEDIQNLPCHNSSLPNSIPVLVASHDHSTNLFIIYLHGNSCDVGQMQPELYAMCNMIRAHVVAPEYPGYGTCAGTPSAKGINAVGQTTLDWLIKEHECDLSQIVIVGRSIGSGPACELALYAQKVYKRSVGGLILHSGYKSITAVANEVAWGIGGLVIPNLWDNEKVLSQLPDTPLLVVHGKMDEIIKFHHGEDLFEVAASQNKTHLWMEQATHNVYKLIDLLEEIYHFVHTLDTTKMNPPPTKPPFIFPFGYDSRSRARSLMARSESRGAPGSTPRARAANVHHRAMVVDEGSALPRGNTPPVRIRIKPKAKVHSNKSDEKPKFLGKLRSRSTSKTDKDTLKPGEDTSKSADN
eukprot:Platyproteum_vivax@DN7364_c1_g1_i2.p1